MNTPKATAGPFATLAPPDKFQVARDLLRLLRDVHHKVIYDPVLPDGPHAAMVDEWARRNAEHALHQYYLAICAELLDLYDVEVTALMKQAWKDEQTPVEFATFLERSLEEDGHQPSR